MKKLTPHLIRITILIIMVQSITRDTHLYAAGTSEQSEYRITGTNTELIVKVLAPSCQGFSNGIADLTINGTDQPYTISWSDGSTDEDLSGKTEGVYAVRVSGYSG